jgi:hypothetical protein
MAGAFVTTRAGQAFAWPARFPWFLLAALKPRSALVLATGKERAYSIPLILQTTALLAALLSLLRRNLQALSPGFLSLLLQ